MRTWVGFVGSSNGKRHPRELDGAQVEQFLSTLAVQGHVAASTQNQALSARALRRDREVRPILWGQRVKIGGTRP